MPARHTFSKTIQGQQLVNGPATSEYFSPSQPAEFWKRLAISKIRYMVGPSTALGDPPFTAMRIWANMVWLHFTSRSAVFYDLSSIFQSSQFVIRMLSLICLNIGTVKLQNKEQVDDFLVIIWLLRFKTRWRNLKKKVI